MLKFAQPDESSVLPLPFLLNCRFNQSVNFCVWVLQELRIAVDPFNAHAVDGLSEATAIIAPEWQNWLQSVVVTQDPRLQWRASQATRRTEVKARREWEAAQFTAALAALGSRALDALPWELWTGEASVRSPLMNVWQRYQGLVSTIGHENEPTVDQITQLYATLQTVCTLPVLQLYLIDYPAAVVHPVAPISVLVTLPQFANSSQLEERLIKAIAQLGRQG